MTSYVADIASFQQGLVPAELRPTCVALEIKATQGSTYVDPDYAGWLTEAKTTGLIPIAYHYLDGTAPAAQAAWLKAHIVDTTLPVMLDFEEGGFQQALEVADAMTTAGLRPKLLYFARGRWETLGSPALAAPLATRGLSLINAAYPSTAAGTAVALYPGDNAPEWAPYGGVTPLLWQYTDNAELAEQRIDVNAYKGTGTQLAALLGETAPKQPAATPVLSWPSQQSGSAGYFTEIVQRAVMLAGQDPKGVDAQFGANTQAAVEAAQKAYGIHIDGQVGPVTWGKLQARTLEVQRALASRGFGAGGTDSVAGPETAQEAENFQRSKRLLEDGICGAHTSAALGIPAV
jgi:peptidoglycan hydrolase-like protein with peptidoglycan-binding domain